MSYIRTAAALSMPTYIALPANPRPTKWRTRSWATVRSRSGRVISVYSRANRRTSMALGVVVELGLFEQRRSARRAKSSLTSCSSGMRFS